jgi:hypothetical protein
MHSSTDHGRVHDLRNQRLFRLLPFERDFARVIAFGNDSHKPIAAHHEKRADVAIGHGFDRVVNGGFRSDGMDRLSFFAQNRADGPGDLHKLVGVGSPPL